MGYTKLPCAACQTALCDKFVSHLRQVSVSKEGNKKARDLSITGLEAMAQPASGLWAKDPIYLS